MWGLTKPPRMGVRSGVIADDIVLKKMRRKRVGRLRRGIFKIKPVPLSSRCPAVRCEVTQKLITEPVGESKRASQKRWETTCDSTSQFCRILHPPTDALLPLRRIQSLSQRIEHHLDQCLLPTLPLCFPRSRFQIASFLLDERPNPLE